jgi:hypothetical protein
MKATSIVTATVIDFNAAREARKARPFQGRLLKSVAAGMDPDTLVAVRVAVADGFAEGKTTAEIARSMVRDQVRAKARAAL